MSLAHGLQAVFVCLLPLCRHPKPARPQTKTSGLSLILKYSFPQNCYLPYVRKSLRCNCMFNWEVSTVLYSYIGALVKAYTFSVSLGRVRMSFMISLSLSPTTDVSSAQCSLVLSSKTEVK